MAAFPLLPNGKVDRVALGTLGPRAITVDETPVVGYVEPSSDTERVLAEIWEQILDVSRVGAADDFFALGGDSLDAMRLLLRAEDKGLTVTLEQVADAPTLAALARSIDVQQGGTLIDGEFGNPLVTSAPEGGSDSGVECQNPREGK
jgi:aryl carrier-like protein